MTECTLQRFLLLSVVLVLNNYVVDGGSLSRSPFSRHGRHRRHSPGIEQATNTDKVDVKKPVCLEPSCVISSARILQTLDTSVHPCDDFYQFSCGGWLKDHEIPGGRSAYGRFEEVRKQNNRIVKERLESESDIFNGSISEGVRKAKDFYNACMNKTYIEAAGGQPLEEVIEALGGWSLLRNERSAMRNHPKNVIQESAPGGFIQRVTAYNIKRVADVDDLIRKQVDSDDADKSHWLGVLVLSHVLALDPLFGMWVTVDDKDSDTHIIAFSQSGLQLMSTDLYNDTDLINAYIELGAMTALLLKYGDYYNPEGKQEVKFFEDAMDKMKGIVEFETKLAEAFVPEDDLEDPEDVYNKMSMEQFADSMPEFDIPLYLNLMFNTTLSKDEDVLVYTPEYFVRLNDIIKETPEQVIQDYIVWQTMFPMLPYLSSSFQSIYAAFMHVLYGSGENGGGGTPLWEICVSETQDALGEVTGALFVQEHMSADTKIQVEEILTNIRQTFIGNLPSLDWMEESTKAKAKTKATAMTDKVGWPDWLLNQQQLDASVKAIIVDPDDQFLNMLWVRLYTMEANLNLLGKPVNKSHFQMSSDVVNAYYDPTSNEMAFPAGILQPPFYSSNSPMAVNYGGIGVVLGHELTHGFDDNGRKYDEFGNLNDWWDDKSTAQYEKRAQCMTRQYDNYQVAENVTINGLATLGENIADNGGIHTAFKAFQSYMNTKQGQKEPLYPGIQNYTQEQLFFIGMAQIWCVKATPESTLLRVLTNEHAPRKI
ncbi:endothelin-converting enzyme homolog [Amphiura filiformis]|uniref:endothelin-converting enzyme homolog n=1 Tax=Amphiura filiformis TaxID=82378 RepID=UPI003B21AE33